MLTIEFTYFPFPRIEKSRMINCVQVDSKLDIALNKLFPIYQRTQARDYIDLYFLCKKEGFTMNDLVKKAKVKFDWHIDPIQLGTQFVRVQEMLDFPKMIKKVLPKTWQHFFLQEAKKFKGQIIKG